MNGAELLDAYNAVLEELHLTRCIIHNKLNQQERQEKETLHQYRERLKKAQMIAGYDEDDWIIV